MLNALTDTKCSYIVDIGFNDVETCLRIIVKAISMDLQDNEIDLMINLTFKEQLAVQEMCLAVIQIKMVETLTC